ATPGAGLRRPHTGHEDRELALHHDRMRPGADILEHPVEGVRGLRLFIHAQEPTRIGEVQLPVAVAEDDPAVVALRGAHLDRHTVHFDPNRHGGLRHYGADPAEIAARHDAPLT